MQNVSLQRLGDCSIRVSQSCSSPKYTDLGFKEMGIISDHINYARTKVQVNSNSEGRGHEDRKIMLALMLELTAQSDLQWPDPEPFCSRLSNEKCFFD